MGSFDQLRVANDRLLESALHERVTEPAPQNTPGLQRLAAYYRSGMDRGAIEARGLVSLAHVLTPVLAQVGGLRRDTLPRVLGPVTNMPAFAAACGCQKGDAMLAADPLVIW